METFPFKKVIIALIVLMVIVAGVGLYLGANESAPATTPTMTPEEQTYRITIENRAAICGQAINALSELMTNLQIGDAQWTFNVAVQLALIQAVYDEAIAIDPPSSMAHIHDKYVQAVEHYETATQLIKQGIDEVNVNLIEQATVELFTGTGTQLLTESIELLNEFILAHSN